MEPIVDDRDALGGALRLRNVTFMSRDPERLATFWGAVLGLTERTSSAGEVLLADADWSFPRFTFQPVDDAQRSPSAVHVDLTADDRALAVRRLVELGATEGETHGDAAMRWTVMYDPDGNEFCVTEDEGAEP